MIARYARRAEFVLHRLHRHLTAIAADDLTGRYQLHRSHVAQQHGPRNGKLHIEPLRQMASRVEADSTAGDIDGPARPRIQEATPTDELPFQFQLQVISPVRSEEHTSELQSLRH